MLSAEEIRDALEAGGVQVTLKYDYAPSPIRDRAAYQEIDFTARVWRDLLLTATGRNKISRQLNERQTALAMTGRGPSAGGLCVRVLTVEAALNLQSAGYELETPFSSRQRA